QQRYPREQPHHAQAHRIARALRDHQRRVLVARAVEHGQADAHQRQQRAEQDPVERAHDARDQVEEDAQDRVHGPSLAVAGCADGAAIGGTATPSTTMDAADTTLANGSAAGASPSSPSPGASGMTPSSQASKILRAIGAAVEPP